MLKTNRGKAAVSLAGVTLTCLSLLLFLSQHHRNRIQTNGMQSETEVGLRSLQSLGESEVMDGAQTESERKKGFSAYFSKLTRSRRDADKPNETPGPATDAPPAEDISAGDLFIAVKTTKKFHRSRLDLLLDTWISRNMQQDASHQQLQSCPLLSSNKACFRRAKEKLCQPLVSLSMGTRDLEQRLGQATQVVGKESLRYGDAWGYKGTGLPILPWLMPGLSVDSIQTVPASDPFTQPKPPASLNKQRPWVDLFRHVAVIRRRVAGAVSPETYIFTDGEDEELKKKIGSHAINTNCSAAHSRQALSCKMAVEYDKFIESGKKWFCHVDDDNYVNVKTLVKMLSNYPHTQDMYIGKPSLDRPIEATERLGDKMRPVNFWFATGGAGFCISRGLALKMSPWASGGHFMNTAEKIRLPDDCTIGYIIESVLGVSLTRSSLFHSHLENLQQVSKSEVHKQITLSYGMFENKRNIINMKGAFSIEEDPSRFKSVHCLLYPDTPWCPPQVAY
ncbi:hypothetical protein DNTS_001788 [Danionella cerebrum]|uniref:O-fucosylpeptide 3-beta-N-acetylglucosaminyltransferase n=1 Tax=Danionella cerebrum TaxID=2873325 RepID=A0A553MNR4_9TELE|nr:hypothetical protein DNTS_001788 [Danionella translucida]TRY54822.1 hypothetical protein DNTS_001788 [Danionella translucida]